MGLQTWLLPFIDFLGNTLLPVLIGLALLFFFWNLVRYAIVGGTNDQNREKARSLMMWGIIAFFVMIFIWGIVRLFTNVFGLQGVTEPVTPDYIKQKNPFWDGSYDDNQDPCDAAPDPDACRGQYDNAV